MADVATLSAATMSTTGTSTPPIGSQKAKPEKPDEAKYKDDLAKAEKELATALEKLVSLSLPAYYEVCPAHGQCALVAVILDAWD